MNTIRLYAPFDPQRKCEVCGRPSVGRSRCPHAIDPKLACPHDEERERKRVMLQRKVGR